MTDASYDHPLGTVDNPITLSPDDEKDINKWYITTLEKMRAKEAGTLLGEVESEVFNGVSDEVVLSALEGDLETIDWSKPKTSTDLSDDEFMELLANGGVNNESN